MKCPFKMIYKMYVCPLMCKLKNGDITLVNGGSEMVQRYVICFKIQSPGKDFSPGFESCMVKENKACIGRDEKGCKMNVDGRRHVDRRRREKGRLVDVDREKGRLTSR